MRTSGRVAVLLLGLIAALGCQHDLIAPLPPGSQPFVAPAAYVLWWDEVEACSGRSGNLQDIHWYVVPNASNLPSLGSGVDGFWTPVGNRIVLAGFWQMDGELVRHEMLHALLGANAPDHPREEFLVRCGGVVACDDKCVQDAGPPPPPDPGTPSVPPDSLELAAEVIPGRPSRSAFSGYFMLALSARNPANHAVVVRLPRTSPTIPPFTFSYALRGVSAFVTDDVLAFDADTIFAPGETKRQIFDLIVQDSTFHGLVPVGDVTVIGAYGSRHMTPLHFAVTP